MTKTDAEVRGCEPGQHRWDRFSETRCRGAYVYRCRKCGKEELNP